MATTAEIKELLEGLELHEGFEKDFEYGGILNKLFVTVKIPDNTDNQDKMRGLFGKNYLRYVTIADIKHYNQTGDADASWVGKDDIVPGVYSYRYMVVETATLLKMPNEKLKEVITAGLSIMAETDKPCEFDVYLQVLLIIAATALAIYTGGLTGWKAYALIVSATIQIAVVTGAVKSTNDQRNLSYVSGALSLYGSYQAFTNSGTSTIAATANFSLAVANFVLDVTSTALTTEHEEWLEKEMQEQQSLREQIEAEIFEQKIRFVYGESYDSTYREGHEKNPYAFITQTYEPFKMQ